MISTSGIVLAGESSQARVVSGTSNQPRDIPPDMAILLHKLELDFAAGTIDQWSYINRREEIMRQVSRAHEQQQQHLNMPASLSLEPPLYPRQIASDILGTPSIIETLKQHAMIRKTEVAFLSLDAKGKETSAITWERLYLKAVKIAYEILSKLLFNNKDSVALLYKDGELCEFAAALFGCFIAGVPAVPVHQDISIFEVIDIINLTGSKLVLYSDVVSKELEKLNVTQRIEWPSKLVKWKTNDMGQAKKSEVSHWDAAPNSARDMMHTAYIEFSRSPLGELRGISVGHNTILHQMQALDVTLSSSPESDGGLVRSRKESAAARRKVFLATLDVRCSIGLILGFLFTVYSGNMLIWAPPKVMEVQGLYAHIVSRCRASLLLADYLGLKRVTYDYQQSPNATRYYSKTQRVDFSLVRWVLENTLTVDGEFTNVLTQRYLKPLGCPHPETAIIPMLTLSEYGGMVISLRDWIGKTTDDDMSELSLVLIDKEALAQNCLKIVESSSTWAEEVPRSLLRVDSFGYPLPDATIAVVNPELSVLVCKGELGEIWASSPCLPQGFFGLRNESKAIFHARCRDGSGTLDCEFLRTGLLGFTFGGKVYVLGLYEDRIRQRVSWIDQKIYRLAGRELLVGNGTRYHYSSHLLATLASEVRQIYDCTIFDVFIGHEYLPVAIVEAVVIRKALMDNNDTASNETGSGANHSGGGEDSVTKYLAIPLNELVLNIIAQNCFDALYKRHCLRLYCVMVVDCDTLPKIVRSGGREIANMLCKKRFLEGSLRSDFVKFFVRNSISMVPHGEDVIGGIWSPYVSRLRSMSLQPFPDQLSTPVSKTQTIDEKTGAILSDFKLVIDILKFRVASNGDGVAFHHTDNLPSGKASKPLTWKKFELRVHAVCSYYMDKPLVKPGQYVILMYSLSEEFAVALYACFLCGIIPIPILPFDLNRIGEDFPAFLGIIRDFGINDVLANEEVERFLKSGPIADAFKKATQRNQVPIRIKNTTKLTKTTLVSFHAKLARFQKAVNFRAPDTIALVWVNFTSDHYRVCTTLTHKNLVGICKVFKETYNLTSNSSVVGCVRHSCGVGFVQLALIGVFLGTTTYLSSPMRYAENPLGFFHILSKLKVKDVFVTEQMLKYAVNKVSLKGFDLSGLKNMMISNENRVEVGFLRKVANAFQGTRLSGASLLTIYTHHFNPMIATRSYMTVAPIDLYLDPIALRQGYILLVNQSEVPNALHVQDSGLPPVCTQIAIVNPDSRRLCKEGEFGEIWVMSDANCYGFTNGPKGPADKFYVDNFYGTIRDGDANVKYMRTGDLGFLHGVSITKNTGDDTEGPATTFQPLFVLGKIADTFEVMGLHHFPADIEATIESCHADIYRNGLCIFKCLDYTIVVCELTRTRYFSSLVPLIVNTVLSQHHLVVDIVAFIKKGEFPISRLGTKQRARIVDAWVQGVVPILASYGVNYGENSMIKLVKEIDEVARDHPITGLKNPASTYYDADDTLGHNPEDLTLNFDG